MRSSDTGVPAEVDPTALKRVLGDYPIRVAVLFGSHARGTETVESDVDVAVAFDDALSTAERHQARLDPTVDLMETIDIDDETRISPW